MDTFTDLMNNLFWKNHNEESSEESDDNDEDYVDNGS